MSEDSSDNSSFYPEPLVVEPVSGVHKQSWIVLHGRGDQARSFANGIMGFLNLPFPDGRAVQEYLPDVRFVFPTASNRKAERLAAFSVKMTQWFDIYSWDSNEHPEWQVEGLRETSAWVHGLMKKEIEAVGAENVVLGGLSQGCASSLISLLLWTGQPIKAVFGLSGWLPFRHLMEHEQDGKPKDGNSHRDAEEESQVNEGPKDFYKQAIKSLCQELGVDSVDSSAAKDVPIFIAHGGKDQTVDIRLGKDAAGCLYKLGFNVEYKEYPTLTHWMRSDELRDVVHFVQSQNGEAKSSS